MEAEAAGSAQLPVVAVCMALALYTKLSSHRNLIVHIWSGRWHTNPTAYLTGLLSAEHA